MDDKIITPKEKFSMKNLKQWKSFLLKLFFNNIPKTQVWLNQTDIISILNKIGEESNMCHMFFPYGSGDDLTGAKKSFEEKCVELHSNDNAYIVNSASLTFESFGVEYEWAYFRLETNILKPSGVYGSSFYDNEELTEISPRNYVNRSIWDQGFLEYDENDKEISLPKTARLVTRVFSGSFVIFSKGSIYNKTSSGTYDGRHNEMTAIEFRKHIEDVIESLKDK